MYSIIVPIYNEADTVAELHLRLVEVFRTLSEPVEFIFVNDGSTDETASILETLKPVTIIQLRNNFGQTAALDAGIKQATGDIIITLDADLQNPPEEIPKLLQLLTTGNYDVVSGWRKTRRDPFGKRLISAGANWLRKGFINDGIHDSGCTLKVYRRACFQDLDLLGEIHRFIPGILRWQGYRIGELEVKHEPRRFGKSKYTTSRILKGFIDMIGVWFWRKYSSRPLHLFGGGGFILISLGTIGLVVLGALRLFWNYSLANSIWPLVAGLCVLSGIQLFVSGLLAEILIKQYYHGKRTPYVIKQITEQV